MIVLDANVLSEMMRASPADRVRRGLESQPPEEVFTTAITEAEILLGLCLLPEGRRRSVLEASIVPVSTEDFEGRILPFDTSAATIFADICVLRQRLGRPISQSDAQIAAIALSRGASLATRNVRDFDGIDLSVVDPWTDDA